MIDWVATHRKHHQLLRHRGRPAQPPRRSRLGLAGRAARLLPRPHRLGVHRHGGRRRADATPRTCSPTRGSGSSTARSSSGWWLGLALRVRARRGADRHGRPVACTGCCGAAPRGSSSFTTRRSASTRCATSSGARTSTPATSRATCRGWRSRPGARRGTTTTTRSRPPTATACAGGRSTPRRAMIRVLELIGLAWDVVRVDPERIAACGRAG